jgi:hypothetical protein
MKRQSNCCTLIAWHVILILLSILFLPITIGTMCSPCDGLPYIYALLHCLFSRRLHVRTANSINLNSACGHLLLAYCGKLLMLNCFFSLRWYLVETTVSFNFCRNHGDWVTAKKDMIPKLTYRRMYGIKLIFRDTKELTLPS